jgi:large subunit ribosomal protein L9
MTMEIILREDVQHLGKAGEVVKVRDGYARNYLLPHGLAYLATEGNKKRIVFEAERVAKERAGERQQAEVAAQALASVELVFKMKVGEEDKLYGSVTAGDVQRLLEERGIHIDKRKVDLAEPLRALGEYRVGLRIHPDVRPEILVRVVAE